MLNEGLVYTVTVPELIISAVNFYFFLLFVKAARRHGEGWWRPW